MVARKPFYFIRHGETLWNTKKLITGQTDIPLNHAGILQAKAAGSFLVNKDISLIYTSPLRRAVQTSTILSEVLIKPIIQVEAFKERGWGEWEGTLHNRSLSNLSPTQIPTGAETFSEFEKRITSALKQILQSSNGIPLIVAHAGVFFVLTKIFGNSSRQSPNCTPFLFLPLPNSCNWSINPVL